jgi:hypothetical protein
MGTMTEWLVRQAGSEPIGPVSTELVLRGIRAGRVVPTAEVCRIGEDRWVPISQVRELSGGDFEDAETNVTDSPWFMQQTTEALPTRPSEGQSPPSMGRPPPPSMGRPPPPSMGHPPPPARPPALGLAPPSQRSAPSPAARPRPPTLGAGPQSSTLLAGQNSYDDVDDNAATRVAGSPFDDFVETRQEQVDDETMTRVARPHLSSPGLPPTRQQADPAKKNVLPTMPMSVVAPQAQPEPPKPDVLPPTQSFGPNPHLPPVIAPLGSFPPVSGSPGTPAVPSAEPRYEQPSGGYSPPQEPPPYPTHYGPPPPADDVQGLKALFALIVFLAVALAIVILLLVIRR